MKIEDGKTYLNCFGDKVIVRLVRPGQEFPFDGDNGMSFMEDGRYIQEEGLPVSGYRLVSEAVNEIQKV